jgi:spore coat protein JC
MWQYQKQLQYPINIKRADARLADYIASQYGGPDGELSASMRYLAQRFSMPDGVSKAALTDMGTEELGHLEMIGTLITQLTKDLSTGEIEKSPLAAYFVDHNIGVYPSSAGGVPWTAAYIETKADPIADLADDMAAEQKARATYDNILRFCNDLNRPDVADVIKFLREREVVHFQRFGETLDHVQSNLKKKRIY